MIFEVIKQGLEEFWPFILLILSSMTCSYFAKLSCKLCMQFAGFAVPLMFAGPVTVSKLTRNLHGEYFHAQLLICCNAPEAGGNMPMVIDALAEYRLHTSVSTRSMSQKFSALGVLVK